MASPMRTTDLKVNDPVHVERGEGHAPLEGIVAYLGKVSFADGQDWVGVKLTGASVGMGKNDGTVQGQQYFTCGPNGGVFVRKSHIKKRTLSRLEELRLKRELAKSGTTTSSPAPKAVSSPTAAATSPTASRTSPSSSSSARSRLDEIRRRREEAAASRMTARTAATRTTPTRPTVSSTTPTRSATSKSPLRPSKQEIEALQSKIVSLETQVESLTSELQSKAQENDSLKQSLATAQEEANEAKTQADSAKQALDAIKEQEETQKQQQAQESSSVMTLEDAREALNAAKGELSRVESERNDLQDQIQSLEKETKTLQSDLEQERQARKADAAEFTEAKASASALELELQAMRQQESSRGASSHEHYKQQAKLQAELQKAHRIVEEMEKQKLEMDTTIEELALDKEELQQEKEALQDLVEELKIDAETAQMEAEEARLEFENSKAAAASATEAVSTGNADDDDAVQALSIQNARLREALIRLREQSAMEKMDLSRDLRAAEKDAATGNELVAQVESLQLERAKLQEEVSDLKDMVEQGSALEGMVEDLSDRVMALEDDNVALQTTIRELEQASEITAEMEEVQAEETKALERDLEERDTIVRNLEEAIRLQRRREEDFQRTVSNYRTSVETLKQEKSALLELQKGEKGEKSDLLQSTQKALARASQLVADGANIRKREAEAVIDRIEAHVLRHLSDRLESFLPQGVVSSELASVKGELLLSKLVEKASRSLDGIATIFTQKIRMGTSETLSIEDMEVDPNTVLTLSDDASQAVGNMIHQSKFALATTDIAADLLRLLSAGQWPDLLTPQSSAELGSLVGHSISDVDVALSDMLRTLKEEGVLSPHQTNLGSFEQSIRNAMEHLNTAIDSDGNLLLPVAWKPPGWGLFRDASVSKFSCLAAGAAVASAVAAEESGQSASNEAKAVLGSLMSKLDQVCSEASKACVRLARLDVSDEKVVASVAEPVAPWKEASSKLLASVEAMLSSEDSATVSNAATCESAADEVLKALVQTSAALRSAGLNNEDNSTFHPLSPEAEDPWSGIASLSRAVRSLNGDEEDVNFLVRTRTIEQQLSDAVANEPKLNLANAKVSSLEKSLASRSKEIAIQNARLSELEKLLARKGSSPVKKSVEQVSTEELNSVKEENRVLTEAMDVLQRQVDEYEQEIRSFKDSKSPQKGGRRNSYMGKRSVSAITEYSTDSRRGRFDLQPPVDAASTASVAAMETALYRPALQSARREAAAYKSQAFVSTLMSLPPLPGVTTSEDEKTQDPEDDGFHCLQQLSAARCYSRLAKASVSIVDLKQARSDKTNSRALLQESLAKPTAAEKRLEQATASATRWLYNHQSAPRHTTSKAGSNLVGRISVPASADEEVSGVIPVTVKSGDLYRMHLHLFQ